MKRVVSLAVLAVVAVGIGVLALNEPGILERAVRVGQANDGKVKVKARLLHRDDTDFYQQTAQITNLSGSTIEISSLCAQLSDGSNWEGERCADLAGTLLGSGKRTEATIVIPREQLSTEQHMSLELVYVGSDGSAVLRTALRPSGSLPIMWMATGVGVAGLITLVFRRPRRRRQA